MTRVAGRADRRTARSPLNSTAGKGPHPHLRSRGTVHPPSPRAGERPSPPSPLSLPRERGSRRMLSLLCARHRVRSCVMFWLRSRSVDSSDTPFERVSIAKSRRVRTRDAARELRRQSTPSEEALWAEVSGRRLNGYRFRRQQPIGPYFVDFFCAPGRLIVEIDGPVQEMQMEYDAERQREIEVAGYRFLRVTADRVLHDLPRVLQEIEAALAVAPPLPRQGEGAGGEGYARISVREGGLAATSTTSTTRYR